MDNIIHPNPQPSELTHTAAQDLQRALLQAPGVHCPDEAERPFAEDRVTVAEDPQAQITYPWNPADPAADAFFDRTERDADLDAELAAELVVRAKGFFAQVDQLWAQVAPDVAVDAVDSPLHSQLMQKFAQRMPSHLLAAIAQQAQTVVASSLSLADQLVNCVEDVLPTFAVEDLQVLARPLAYAMRGEADTNPWDTLLSNVRPVKWETLSEIEQARVSLAIARYALAELEQSTEG
jgi:hypothetical protein